MITSIKYKLEHILKKDSERSQKIVKNVIMSFGVKGGSIAVSLLLVPITINYINPVQYGIWLTISSIVGWMSFFDIGLGHGLRNKLSQSFALDRFDDAKIFVSTTYAVLTIISALMFIIFQFANQFIDWKSLLNIPSEITEDIHYIILIVFASFCIQFVVQIVNTILTATHEPAKVALISFLGQLGVLIFIIILKSYVPGSLSVLVWVLTLIPIITLILASVYFFRYKLKRVAPSFSKINFHYAKDILTIGGSFFIIQIGALFLFQTNNFIIAKVLGPSYVTEYNVAYKLFSVITMVFTILVTPYWSAFTDAYAKMDFEWMKKNVVIIRKFWLMLSVGAIVLCLVSEQLYKIWLGDEVKVSTNFSIAMTFFVISLMLHWSSVYFLNGIGRVKLQMWLMIIGAVINIPLAVYLGKKFGLAGIISSNSIIFLVMGIVFFIQTQKILSGKASGIWNK